MSHSTLVPPRLGRSATLPEVRFRRPIGALAAVTSVGALAGAVQLALGVATPPVHDLAPLHLHSWVLPAFWLAASVGGPCAAAALRAFRRSPTTGMAAVVAGAMLGLELLVQVPFVGLDVLQAVFGAVALVLVVLGTLSRRSG